MAVMDAAICEALWRHTAQINFEYAKPNYEGFSRIVCYIFYRCLILVTLNYFPQNKPNIREEEPLKMIF